MYFSGSGLPQRGGMGLGLFSWSRERNRRLMAERLAGVTALRNVLEHMTYIQVKGVSFYDLPLTS
jgi:hypothetical protein